jgi:hypothetical protein
VKTTGDHLYAWQVQEPDGRWSMVGAMVVAVGTHMPLIHRDYDVVMQFKDYALSHASMTGQKLRLARFALAEVLEGDGAT